MPMSMEFSMVKILLMESREIVKYINYRGLELIRDLEDWMVDNEYGKIVSIVGHNDILDVNTDITRLGAYYKALVTGEDAVTISASDYIQIRYDISFHSKSYYILH